MLLTLEMVLLFKYAAQYREAISYGGQIWVWIHPAPNPDLQNMITRFLSVETNVKCLEVGSYIMLNTTTILIKKYFLNKLD